jgi:phosphoribulokinase
VSVKHPIISVTGSSGAGTTTVKHTFEQIFRREGIKAAWIEGDAFHRFDRQEMRRAMAEAAASGNNHLSHFGVEANLLEVLEEVFEEYGRSGGGRTRHYVHDELEAERYGRPPGSFTEWEPFPTGTDLLFYEGLHGAVVTETVNLARHADLKIGVVPVINLEWIQKIHRDRAARGYTTEAVTDTVNLARHADLKIGVVPVINLEWIQKIHRDRAARGYTTEAVTDTILRRMPDYVRYICPQFTETDVNFQRVPTVDTSNPFIARWIPTPDESMVVIRFRNPRGIDFPYLLSMIPGSFMSRANSIVVPGAKLDLAMQLIMTPMVLHLVDRARRARG